MVRYQGHAAMARLTVPFAHARPFDFPSTNVVDLKAAAKWRELGLVPSSVCTDSEFLRRAMLDAIGTTPSPDEIEDFIADQSPDKRASLVDRILDRPEYVDYWTLKWGDVLRVNSEKLGAQGMLAFNLWLREAFRSNMHVDRMAEELVTAQGSIFSNGPANYYRVATSPDDLAETTAQVFMGVRLQCARCHHHPFEAYGQDDYYSLAAYFARVRTKRSDEFGLFGGDQVIYRLPAGRGFPAADRQEDGTAAARRQTESTTRSIAVVRLARWLTTQNPSVAGPQRRQPILGLPARERPGQPDRRSARDEPPLEPRAARRPG